MRTASVNTLTTLVPSDALTNANGSCMAESRREQQAARGRTCRLLAKLKLFLVALRSTGGTLHLSGGEILAERLTIDFVGDNNAGDGRPVLLQLRVPFRQVGVRHLPGDVENLSTQHK
jgi:hypothetical protein